MKKLINAILSVLMVVAPKINYGQAPALGTAANFVLFSSVGAVTNTGISQVTGNVGTNVGSSTGFGNVNGVMDDQNGASLACANDLLIAYNELDTATPNYFISTTMGNNDTLVKGVYRVPAAATLGVNLVLDAQGNSGAVFIFQVQGALSVSALTKVILINGAQACNVFWKVEGLVDVATGSSLKGTIIAHNAAISLGALDTLEGRALSITGAVTVNGVFAYTPLGCSAPILQGPAAPNLLSTKYYGIFSSDGPVTNTGITHVVGDVGTNVGLTTGFDPLLVTGMIHPIPDPSTATCASDLTIVYNYLEGLTYDIELLYPAQFGHNLVLTPHTYLLNAATALTDSLYLNAEGNSNAIFVIQINGALSTSSFARVILMNGTRSANVYWKVDGAVTIADSSVFCGTLIVNNAAILFNLGTMLNGRALTTTGAVTINGSTVIGFTAPDSGTVTGNSTVCVGSSITLSDNTSSSAGVWGISNPHATITSAGIVTGVTAGIDTVHYTVTDSFGTTVASTIITINPLPNAGAITGGNTVCLGSTLSLTDLTTGGNWSATNSRATVLSGTVNPVTAGIDTILYIVSNSCGADTATKIITITTLPNAGTISGSNTVCMGAILVLTDITSGGSWSSSNALATVTSGTVTPVSAGVDTIRYIITNTCGTDTATKAITINPLPNAGNIFGGNTVCIGSVLSLSDLTTGGSWLSSNSSATVSLGTVTPVTVGVDTIMYVVSNSCGFDTVSRSITISTTPMAGAITGNSYVCLGYTTTLLDAVAGGIWSASNGSMSVDSGVVTGIVAGTDTIFYKVTNSCGADSASAVLSVNPLPNAGIIGGDSTVCVGSMITLTETVAGGTWSISNTNASISGNIVTGAVSGLDTVSYLDTNLCGSDFSQKTITINALPTAGPITGVSSVCVGSTITLSAPVINGIWMVSNNNASISDSVVTGITPGTDTVLYAISNVCGNDTATTTVAIIAQPFAGIISGANTVCMSSSTLLTADSTGGAWSSTNSNGAISAGLFSGITTGTDTVLYAVSNFCGSDTAVKIMNIITTPNPGTISGPSKVCVGSLITLIADSTGGVWTSNHLIDTVVGGIVLGITPGIDTVGYTFTNTCGTNEAMIPITVNPLPNAGEITGATYVCVGTSITLTDTVTSGLWLSNHINDTIQTGVVYGITSGYDTIMYLVSNSCGTDTAFAPIVISALPNAGSIIGSANLCVNTTSTLTDSISGGVWVTTNTDVTISGGIVSGLSAGTDTIFYAVTNICGNDTAIKILTINPRPFTPTITILGPSTVCAGTMYQNFGTSTPPPIGVKYSWSAANAVVWATSNNGQNALVSFPDPGLATVMLSDNFVATQCNNVNNAIITVGQTVADEPRVIYFESHFVCTPNNEDYYQWGYDDATTLDSTLLPGEVNQDYLNINPDFTNKLYWVMTGKDGCNQKTYQTVPTGIQNVNSNSISIEAYPNPANDIVNVAVSTSIGDELQLDIQNINGQKAAMATTISHKSTVNLSGMPAGFYLINCFHNGVRIATTRFIKN